jgi:hypothetical protein
MPEHEKSRGQVSDQDQTLESNGFASAMPPTFQLMASSLSSPDIDESITNLPSGNELQNLSFLDDSQYLDKALGAAQSQPVQDKSTADQQEHSANPSNGIEMHEHAKRESLPGKRHKGIHENNPPGPFLQNGLQRPSTGINRDQDSDKGGSKYFGTGKPVAVNLKLPSTPLQMKASETEEEDFPWIGMVKPDAWSSGFYSAPDKATKTLDLAKETKVRAKGRSGGWVHIEILSGDHQGKTGYISSERVVNLSQSEGRIESEPYSDELAGEKLEGESHKLKAGYEKAIFYSQEGDKIFVVPADRIEADPQKKTVDHQTLVHAFQDRGAMGFTTLYITYPGEDTYAPVKWYSEASQAGMMDIWGALLDELYQLTESMQGKEWNPGKQPPNFYIGNAAHLAIVEYYKKLHFGQQGFYNYVPIASILQAYAKKGVDVNLDSLSEKELRDKPDITNISLDNLYEIKPWNAASQAVTEVTYYQQIFLKAGVPMEKGPMTDPGAKGAMEIPGGFIVFFSPSPGVILYKKKNRQPDQVPEPGWKPHIVPVSQPITEPDAIRPPKVPIPLIHPFPKFEPQGSNIWEWKYWEETTGMTGAALLIYLIVSEGSRLFPPRNLLPVP